MATTRRRGSWALHFFASQAVARPIAALLVPLLLMTSCGAAPRKFVRKYDQPSNVSRVSTKAPYLLAHMRDGRAIVLDSWSVNDAERTVTGLGRELDVNRAVVAEGAMMIAIDDVALFDSLVLGIDLAGANFRTAQVAHYCGGVSVSVAGGVDHL